MDGMNDDEGAAAAQRKVVQPVWGWWWCPVWWWWWCSSDVRVGASDPVGDGRHGVRSSDVRTEPGQPRAQVSDGPGGKEGSGWWKAAYE